MNAPDRSSSLLRLLPEAPGARGIDPRKRAPLPEAVSAAVCSFPSIEAAVRTTIATDTCVPISRLADCLLDSIDEADASGLPYFLVGHVGDGNFHFGYLIDPASTEERATAERLNHARSAQRMPTRAPAGPRSDRHHFATKDIASPP